MLQMGLQCSAWSELYLLIAATIEVEASLVISSEHILSRLVTQNRVVFVCKIMGLLCDSRQTGVTHSTAYYLVPYVHDDDFVTCLNYRTRLWDGRK